MSACQDLLDLLRSHGRAEAMVSSERSLSFDELLAMVAAFEAQFAGAGIGPGSVVAIEGDFSPGGVASLLAAIKSRVIAIPLTPSVAAKKSEFHSLAQTEWILTLDAQEQGTLTRTGLVAGSDLIQELRRRGNPGLILFSSGSTGRSKAVVHDMELLTRKYLRPRHSFRTLAFLMFDHIGGVDTLLYNLANGSCLVTIPDHSPEKVCQAIERHRAEVLPTSPTFLNLMLIGGAHTTRDLSSLKIITYGAEVMSTATLDRLREAFPDVKLMQKFGTTEVGTLRSQSRDSGSVWVRIGGEGYETRVRNGLLEIKAESAMLGYLNAPSPFTEDGWFMTGDAVEVDGEWMRILGRETEIINVGGEKVYPAEVENVLQTMENVAEVTVTGEPNPLTGNVVVARFRLIHPEEPSVFRNRVRTFCQERLERFKTPARITITGDAQHNARFKKMRLQEP